MSGPWPQYPGYGVQGGQPGYQAQGYQAPGPFPNRDIHGHYGAYPASHPGEQYSQPGNYYSTAGYHTQGGPPNQQYGQSYYHQPQYGPQQPSYGYQQHPSYPQQPIYSQQMASQPPFQQPHQYQQQQLPYPAQAIQQPQPQAPMPPSSQQSGKYKLARPSLSTCYNCGSPDHMAMNCQEPRREAPHGAMIEKETHQHQKQRHQPPIITRYPVPPHVAAQHMTPTSPSPAFGPQQQGFPPVHNPQQQWQSHSPPVQPPHGFQQGPQPYGIPTPRSSISQGTHPQISPMTPQHSVPTFENPSNSPNQEAADPLRNSQRRSSNYPADPDTSHARRNSNASSHKASTDQSVSMQTASDADDEEDEWRLLDVPDLPWTFESSSPPKPKLVKKPIRALDAAGSEAGSPVHESAAEDKDFLLSKYFESTETQDLLVNVSQTDRFEYWQEDPIFASIHTEADTTVPRSVNRSDSAEVDGSSLASNVGQLIQHYNDQPNRNDEPGTPPYHTASSSPRARDAFDLDANDFYHDESRSGNHPIHDPGQLPGLGTAGLQPPPPPPPPPVAQRYPRATNNFSNGGNHSAYFTGGKGRNGSSNGLQDSPNAHTPDRKRKVETTDFAQSPERDRKRQEDDYIPKHKRNQPKVAEAYSRRW